MRKRSGMFWSNGTPSSPWGGGTPPGWVKYSENDWSGLAHDVVTDVVKGGPYRHRIAYAIACSAAVVCGFGVAGAAVMTGQSARATYDAIANSKSAQISAPEAAGDTVESAIALGLLGAGSVGSCVWAGRIKSKIDVDR